MTFSWIDLELARLRAEYLSQPNAMRASIANRAKQRGNTFIYRQEPSS